VSTKVGDALSYKGRQYIVTRLEKHTSQQVAEMDALEMEAALKSQVNVRYLKMEVAHFEEGDIINVHTEFVVLRCGQIDTQFIYTTYRVEKEQGSGQNRLEKDVNQAANPAAQTDDGRTGGGTSPG